MIYVAVVLSLVAFVFGLKFSRAIAVARNALNSSHQGLAMLADRSLSDREKERIARQASLQLFAAGGKAGLRLILALLAPAAVLGLAVLSGLVQPDALWSVLLSWPMMIAGLLAFVAAFILDR